YSLLFERFLNPERISMPDIDVDFCINGRERVIQYVREKYGSDNVAQIITFGSMLARAVIRDVGRGMGMPYGDVDKIAKLVPNPTGKKVTLTDALRQEPKLKEMVDKEPKVRQLFDVALALEGLTRHASTHAAGVVITPKPLTDYLPLYVDPKSQGQVTQFDMVHVEKIGLVKFDFLGLK
ncbi:MAG: DNA polymerase III subunit alpha, partial [Desulfuromonadales bacterium]